jgi:hypothetical protein
MCLPSDISSTLWSKGTFNEGLGYYIKYGSEYKISEMYKSKFKESGHNIYTFYKNIL